MNPGDDSEYFITRERARCERIALMVRNRHNAAGAPNSVARRAAEEIAMLIRDGFEPAMIELQAAPRR